MSKGQCKSHSVSIVLVAGLCCGIAEREEAIKGFSTRYRSAGVDKRVRGTSLPTPAVR